MEAIPKGPPPPNEQSTRQELSAILAQLESAVQAKGVALPELRRNLDSLRKELEKFDPPTLFFAFQGPSRIGKSSLLNALLDSKSLLVESAGNDAVTDTVVEISRDQYPTYRAFLEFRSRSEWEEDIWESILLARPKGAFDADDEEEDEEPQELTKPAIELLQSLVGEAATRVYASAWSLAIREGRDAPSLPEFSLPLGYSGRYDLAETTDLEVFQRSLAQFIVTEKQATRLNIPLSPFAKMRSFIKRVCVRGPFALKTEPPCNLPSKITLVDMPGSEWGVNYRSIQGHNYVKSALFATESPRGSGALPRELGFRVLVVENVPGAGGWEGVAADIHSCIVERCFDLDLYPKLMNLIGKKRFPAELLKHVKHYSGTSMLPRAKRTIVVVTKCETFTPEDEEKLTVKVRDHLDQSLGSLAADYGILREAVREMPIFYTGAKDNFGISRLAEHFWQKYAHFYDRCSGHLLAQTRETLEQALTETSTQQVNKSMLRELEGLAAQLASWKGNFRAVVTPVLGKISAEVEKLQVDTEDLSCACNRWASRRQAPGITVKAHLLRWVQNKPGKKTEIPEPIKLQITRSDVLTMWENLFLNNSKSLLSSLRALEQGLQLNQAASSEVRVLERALIARLSRQREKFVTDVDEIWEERLQRLCDSACDEVNSLYRAVLQTMEKAPSGKGLVGIEELRKQIMSGAYIKLFRSLRLNLLSAIRELQEALLAQADDICNSIPRPTELTELSPEHQKMHITVANLRERLDRLSTKPPRVPVFAVPKNPAGKGVPGVRPTTTFLNDYEHVRFLKPNVVELMKHRVTGKQVIRKTLSPELLARESQALERLQAAKIYISAHLVHAEQDSLVIEYLDSFDISISPVELLKQLLERLKAAHEIGVFHCDIKLVHIMMAREGVRLIDWDHACVLGEQDSLTVDATGREASYLPPELRGTTVTYPREQAHALDMWCAGFLVLAYIARAHGGFMVPSPPTDACIESVVARCQDAREACSVPQGQVAAFVRILRRMLCAQPAERWTAVRLLHESSLLSGAPDTRLLTPLKLLLAQHDIPHKDLPLADLVRLIEQCLNDVITPTVRQELITLCNNNRVPEMLCRWWFNIICKIPPDADKNATSKVPEAYYHGQVHQFLVLLLPCISHDPQAIGFRGSELKPEGSRRRIDCALVTAQRKVWLLEFKIDDAKIAADGAIVQMLSPYSHLGHRSEPYTTWATSRSFTSEDIYLLGIVFPAKRDRPPTLSHVHLQQLGNLDAIYKLTDKGALEAELLARVEKHALRISP